VPGPTHFSRPVLTETLHPRPSPPRRMFQERIAVLQQRLMRNKLFTRPALQLGSTGGQVFCELTPVQTLMGAHKGDSQFVLGLISQLEDGRFFLEDATGSVAINLADCDYDTGFFTESSVVVAEGVMGHDNVFKVSALGFPPTEPALNSKSASHGLEFFGGPVITGARWERVKELAADRDDERLVFLR